MRKIRVGVIGMGGMGYAHCKDVIALEQTELTCISSRDKEVVNKNAQEFGVKPFTDYKEMITSGLCDAVIIATPHWTHPEISVYAFENGLHVLAEKPIAVTVADADRMIKSAKDNNRVFSMMMQRRAEPRVKKALELVKKGYIGEIVRTLCIDSWFRTQAYYNSNIWRATWKGEGAGVLVNQAPHMVDIFLLLGGLPIEIETKTRTAYHDIEVENEVHALLEYKNGACGYYYVSTLEPIEGHHIEICGEKGKLVLDSQNLKFYKYEKSIPESIVSAEDMWETLKYEEVDISLDTDAMKGHIEVIRNFADSILNGEELITPGEEGLYSVEFYNACILSWKKNKSVKLPIDREEYNLLIDELVKTSKPKKNVKIQRATDPKYRK
jgi:predicted dehydrogenase